MYQSFHPHFLLACSFFLFVLLLFLFCFGFVLELEMYFFCLVLFFGTFRFTEFFVFFFCIYLEEKLKFFYKND